MQRVVVDPEMMGHFVDNRHADLLDQLLKVPSECTQWSPVERDDIGHYQSAIVITLGQRHALIEPQKILGRVTVSNNDGDVVHQFAKLGWQRIQRLAHDAFETALIHDLHRRDPTGAGGDGPLIAR